MSSEQGSRLRDVSVREYCQPPTHGILRNAEVKEATA
jgi:hypothetical protein